MSGTASSSSSRSQRPPLHERSNSEQNKLGIRIVPYSPPRPADDPGSAHSLDPEFGHDGGEQPLDDPAMASPTRRKGSFARDYPYASHPGSPLASPTSSTTSLARAKGRGVSGTKLGSDSSGIGPSTPPPPVRTRSSYGSINSEINAPAISHHDDRPTSSSLMTPKSRRGNHITIHPDKTFSIVLKPIGNKRTSDKTDSSLTSPPVSNYSTISSHEAYSFDATDDDRPSSALSSLAERSVSPYTPGSAALTEAAEDPPTHSPWNYRMVGGLRKVERTPDPREKGKGRQVLEANPSSPLPALEEIPSSPPEPSHLATKPSFNSDLSVQTDSTIEETTNYKVIGRSSPPLPDPEFDLTPSPSSSNVNLLGESSPAHPFPSTPAHSVLDTPGSKNFVVHSAQTPAYSILDTPGSKNFVVHGHPTPSSSLPPTVRRPRRQESNDSLVLRGQYSQESLIVPPLNTVRRKSSEERLGYYKQRSRESLRRANSFSSISSLISSGTASLFLANAPNIVRLQHTPSTSSLQPSSWAGTTALVPAKKPRMEAPPHQWSSQLSTVMSEDEQSEGGSRHLSASSFPDRGSFSRGSRHSRHMLSISSSLAAADELAEPSSHSRSNSRTDSLDRPGPPYMRGGREPAGTSRQVRHVDEHGDGLADLHQLHSKGSRSRLAHFLSPKSSDRDLHSSSSSRAGSLTASSLPAWARVYYGSGERRWLAPPSIRSYSDDSRPASSWGPSVSPIDDEFPPNIFSPRRRPREVNPDPDDRPISTEITPIRYNGVRLGVRKMTSSIWSPHLQQDRRASRITMWNPPSTTWSQDNGPFGRRNVQVLLFAIGFVIPFAWMIAALLPLPERSKLQMVERGHSTTQFGIPEEPEPFAREFQPVDDIQFQSARWWRNLNRGMSVVGLIVIGAIIALAIVGFWQNMKR